MAEELRPRGITAPALSPGFLRSEAMLDHLGVTEANWQEAGKKDRHFLESESPLYIGRAVAALAADDGVVSRTGRLFTSGRLAREYGFTDQDGRQPDFERYFMESSDEELRSLRGESLRSHERFLKTMG